MRRVEYDINKSEYHIKVNSFDYYFSSVFNLKRFVNNYDYFVEEETNKLKAKYKVNIDIYDYLVMVFYKKIEKRGFKVLIHKDNDIIEVKENYIYKLYR